MKPIYLLLLFISNLYAQTDFELTTSYRLLDNGKYKVENNSFRFNEKENRLFILDSTQNIIQKFEVEFYKSSYSKDKKNFLVALSSITNETILDKFDQDYLGMFTFVFDKDKETLLYVKILPMVFNENFKNRPKKEYFYLTDKGKKIKDK